MALLLSNWIDEAGDGLVAALELAADRPEEFAAACQGVGRAVAGVEYDCILMNEEALRTVAKQLSGIEVAHPLSTYALDNLVSYTAAFRVATRPGLYSVILNILRQYRNMNAIGGVAIGHRYFVNRYRKIIAEICVFDDEGDRTTGTGFVLTRNNEQKTIFTCRHVMFNDAGGVRRVASMKVGDREVTPMAAISFKNIDVSAVEINEPIDGGAPYFMPGELLEDIITAGFPKLQTTKESPLLFHKGQITGYTGSPAEVGTSAIISAAVAPGCSGGPVFNSIGAVVGIVDQRIRRVSRTVS